MLVTQGNVGLLFRGFTVKFWEAFAASAPPMLLPLIMDSPSTGLEEQHDWLTATNGIRELIDEAQINAIAANSYTIVNKEYEETLELKEMAIRGDKYGLLTPRLQMLGANAAAYPDELIAQLLSQGLSGTGIDYTGSSFFGTNKVSSPGAKPFTNISTLPLNSVNYGVAKANLKARTNAKGRPLNLGLDLRLITSVANEVAALQILQAENTAQIATNTAGTPGTNVAIAGVTNVNKGTAKLVAWPWLDALGMEDCWFLADFGNPMKPFIRQTLLPWTYYTLDNPQSEYVLRFHKFLYQIYSAFAIGYGFPETIWGSDGSG